MTDHLVVDGHNDLPWAHRALASYDLDVVDLAVDQPSLNTDLPRLRRGGVGAQFWSVFVPSTLPGGETVSATLEQIAFVHRMSQRYDDLVLARTADEVEAAMAEGRIASLIGMEGGHSINGSLAVLRMMFELGARYMTLTHNDNLAWADSGTDVEALGGLGPFGVEVVGEMNRIGMMVDLSHVSVGTMRDAVACSQAPVIFSHANPAALCDVEGNVPDDVLQAMAAGGGVCMASFIPQYVSIDSARWYDECKKIVADRGLNPRSFDDLDPVMSERMRNDPPPAVTVADLVPQLNHLRELVGIDHIGIGSDFDGTVMMFDDLRDVSTFPVLLGALAEAGWSDAEIGKVANGNILRVMRDVEAVARDLS